jgi:transposase
MTGVVFRALVEVMLAPALSPVDIVPMDNVASLKVAVVMEAIDAVGADIWQLPPYSRDLIFIEQTWWTVKNWLRRVAVTTTEGFARAVADALGHVDPDECRAYITTVGTTHDDAICAERSGFLIPPRHRLPLFTRLTWLWLRRSLHRSLAR